MGKVIPFKRPEFVPDEELTVPLTDAELAGYFDSMFSDEEKEAIRKELEDVQDDELEGLNQ